MRAKPRSDNLEIMSPGPGIEVDDAGLRMIECTGYLQYTSAMRFVRVKPAGVYIECKGIDGKWKPISGPYWGGPLGGWPPEAEAELRRLLPAR